MDGPVGCALALGYPFDDTAAFQRCLDQLPSTGGEIQFGEGKYYLHAVPRITKPLVIRGVGSSDRPSTSATQLQFYGETGLIFADVFGVYDLALVHVENTTTGGGTATPADSTPLRQWRPSRTVAVGTTICPAVMPTWFADITANRPPHYGWAFMCTKAGGSTVQGATGTTGATEPLWRNENPKMAFADLAKAVTINIGTGVFTSAAHGWSSGQAVRFRTTGTLPTGITTTTTVYIRDVTADDFKVAATPGGTAIALSGTQSGTHEVLTAVNMSVYVDNNVEWTPIMAHGIEAQGRGHIARVLISRFPGNAINYNGSSNYRSDTSTVDSRFGPDASRCFLGSIIDTTITYAGGDGIFSYGPDSSPNVYMRINVRQCHMYGVQSRGAFPAVFIGACHFDGNEAGYIWSAGDAFIGSYCEATNLTGMFPVIKEQAQWIGGTSAGFSGIRNPPPTTWTNNGGAGKAWALNDFVKPTVDNGWWYKCVKAGTGSTTTEPTWKKAMCWFLSAEEQGIDFNTTDTYLITTDGTAEFRAVCSSELSSGQITYNNTDYAHSFINPYHFGRFYAAGPGTSVMAYDMDGTQYPDAGQLTHVWDDTNKWWAWLRNGLSTQVPYVIAGANQPAGIAAGSLDFYRGFYNEGKFRGTATAAPTTGTWRVGDHVENSTPAVGQPKGWWCTVAGTPGTWVSEGNL
jgi:hypothetical protein